MDYFKRPLLESFFTKDKMNELLVELQETSQDGSAWEEFWFIYNAKAYYEDELSNRFLAVLKDFYCHLIDLNRLDIIIKLMNVSVTAVTFSSDFRDLCPLCYAIYRNNDEMAKAMLDRITLEEIESIDGVTPGYLAIDNGDLGIVSCLLDKGCRTKSFAGDYSALQFAVLRLKLEIVDMLLLDYHVNANEMGPGLEKCRYPPLTLAVKSDIVDLVAKLLAQAEIDVNQLDEDGSELRVRR